MLITRTPLRISLIGGSTDVPAFYKKNAGAVVSFAINKYIYVSVNEKFDGKYRVSYSKTENVKTVDEIQHNLVRESLKLFNIKKGLEITSVSDIPGSGTGLGSSSAFTVGLLKALGKDDRPAILAERAFVVEAEMCFQPIGKQDAYASAHGGLNYMAFHKNSVQVIKLNQSPEWISEFEKHSLLLWTGRSRDANEILKLQNKGFQDGGNTEMGKMLSQLANDLYVGMLNHISIQETGVLLQEAWKVKKFLAFGISDAQIEGWYDNAMRYGSYGGKLLGAGGGGFLFFLAPPDRHAQIIEKTGLRKIPFNIEMTGSEVIYDG
jgi:D-glycero-alpha-D-manno-heptose-7-phosphate kinase